MSTRPARTHLFGNGSRGALPFVAVGALIGVLSAGFVVGIVDLGVSLAVGGVALALAVASGAARGGLLPTVGALWIFAVWWFVFPPMVGLLTGNWETGSRYTYPRFLDYGYASAAAEVRGGIEQGVTNGVVLAALLGTGGYLLGTVGAWIAVRR
ncbi:hypothetical protein [Halorubrum vacuolatum]|uniref:Uncharacterized protein n=1 Tax=Halorubrum vacuolatum TaxID=63740 RepID=A0A238UQ15_HALVU|nr:hypothetical protein [Halorubrum vacuolatum]SNR23613.1 hypothetical protein SAMN06264855_101148 [Halorubrum vacuolatum]